MIKNYFKIAWRNLWKNKIYSLICIIGLSLGLTSCLLISTVVLNELSYDKNWSKSSNIYRLITENKNFNTTTIYSPIAIAPEFKNDFPLLENYCRLQTEEGTFKFDESGEASITYLRAEETIWDVLDFKVLSGSPEIYINGYPNLIISQKLKNQYFPNINPVGRIIKSISNNEDSKDYLITGVIETLPTNSIFRSDAIVVKKLDKESNVLNPRGASTWGQQFLLLRHGTSAEEVTQQLNTWFYEKMEGTSWKLEFSIQPLQDVYLKSEGISQQALRGNWMHIQILSWIAFLLLLIACINYVNLTTARIGLRIKETGIRKVLGASRNTLFVQYLCESLLFFSISFCLSVILYVFLVPSIESFIGHPLSMNLFNHSSFIYLSVVVLLLLSIITGIYPAVVFSKAAPNSIVSKGYDSIVKNVVFQKALVILQFIITSGVLIISLTVNKQMDYLFHKDLGYEEENLITIDYTDYGNKAASFKNELIKLSDVKGASISSWNLPVNGGTGSMSIDDPLNSNNKVKVWFISGDKDLSKTIKLNLIRGRNLDDPSVNVYLNKDKSENDTIENSLENPVLITRYTAERLGIDVLDKPNKSLGAIPVGIVEDFHNQSLRSPIQPTIISINKASNDGYLLVRLSSKASANVINEIKAKYKEFYPNNRFNIAWVEDDLEKEFRAEEKLQTFIHVFGSIIVFLSCLGLFGLVTYMVQNKVKEISVRKVLGASVSEILLLLSKESILLIILAVLIAVPIAWYGLNRWLMEYVYRIDLSADIFIIGSLIVLFIAMMTMSLLTIKAALQNPSQNLRND